MIKKVLIVDDDGKNEEKNLKLLGLILQSHNYDFETAKNGREALEKISEYSPNMIFLDVMMPEMDGYETCKMIRKNPETHNIPIVMVTALGVRKQGTKALRQAQMIFSQNLLIRQRLQSGQKSPESKGIRRFS